MLAIVQKDSPWIWGFNNKEYYLSNQWVYNTKRHGISQATLKYLRVDPDLRAQKQKAWNQPVIWPMFAGIGLLLMILIPGIRAYRQRQKLTIEDQEAVRE